MPDEPTNAGNSSDAGVPRSANEPDERALELLWKKGRIAWKEVESATGWVEDLRGNQILPSKQERI